MKVRIRKIEPFEWFIETLDPFESWTVQATAYNYKVALQIYQMLKEQK
jgi:hypothetical protein